MEQSDLSAKLDNFIQVQLAANAAMQAAISEIAKSRAEADARPPQPAEVEENDPVPWASLPKARASTRTQVGSDLVYNTQHVPPSDQLDKFVTALPDYEGVPDVPVGGGGSAVIRAQHLLRHALNTAVYTVEGGVDAKDGVVAMAAFITAAMDHLTLSRKYAVAGRGRAHLLDKPEGAPREVLSESERARIRRATPKPAQGRGRANNDSGNSYRARGSRGGRGRGRGNFRRKGSYNSDRSRSSSSSKGGDHQRKQK